MCRVTFLFLEPRPLFRDGAVVASELLPDVTDVPVLLLVDGEGAVGAEGADVVVARVARVGDVGAVVGDGVTAVGL